MEFLTLRVLDGPDRGRQYKNTRLPISIGREEGNLIQLNDDRISRYHLKIQVDEGQFILTDLQSTNGTKVNGESVSLWTLRFGDIITVGRSVLLVGSQADITARINELEGVDMTSAAAMGDDEFDDLASLSLSLEEGLYAGNDLSVLATLHALVPPELPSRLTAAQAAQISEVFQYMHLRMRALVQTIRPDTDDDKIMIGPQQWQELLDLYDRMARYLRDISNPE